MTNFDVADLSALEILDSRDRPPWRSRSASGAGPPAPAIRRGLDGFPGSGRAPRRRSRPVPGEGRGGRPVNSEIRDLLPAGNGRGWPKWTGP